MSRKPNKTLLLALACVVALVAALLLFRSKEPASGAAQSGSGTSQNGVEPRQSSGDGQGRTRAPRPNQDGNGVSSRVDRIITDESLTDSQAGSKLLAIAAQGDLELEEREEALSHAVMLIPEEEGGQLVDLAATTGLPPVLGNVLLGEFHNRKDPVRLQGAVALAGQQDPEIRGGGLDLVRFLVGEADDDDDDAAMLAKAQRRLQETGERERK